MMTKQDIQNRKTPPRPDHLPKWFLSKEDGSDADIADDLFAATYWHLRDQVEAKAREAGQEFHPDKDLIMQSQLFADAMMQAGEIAAKKSDDFQRAFHRLVYINKIHGFFRMTQEEYSSVEEWLLDRLPNKVKKEVSNIMYMLSTIFPILEKIGEGWEPEQLIKFQDNWSKTQACIPVLREKTDSIEVVESVYGQSITDTQENIKKLKKKKESLSKTSPERAILKEEIELLEESCSKLEQEKEQALEEAVEDFKETFEHALVIIADPKIPTNGPNGVGELLRKKSPTAVIFRGDKCYIAQKVIFIAVLPARYEQAYESMLRNLTTFNMTDGFVMMEILNKLIKKEKL